MHPGIDCPKCGLDDKVWWAVTTSDYEIACDRCNIRFTWEGEVQTKERTP